jgi:hypothetical protein
MGAFLVPVEVGQAGLGDGVDLLAFLLGRRDEVLVFQRLQSRVDHPRAWAVGATRALLHLSDDVVSVPRLLFQKFEDGELDAAAAVVAAPGAAPTAGIVSIGVHDVSSRGGLPSIQGGLSIYRNIS